MQATEAPSADSTGTANTSTTDDGAPTPESESESESESDDETTASRPSCSDMGGACAPATPDGWSPPEITRVDPERRDDTTMCTGSFPFEQSRAFASPVVPPAQCECACELAADVTCDSARVDYLGNCDCSSIAGCSAVETYHIDTNSCAQPVNQASPAWWVVALDPPSGTCDALAVEAIPEPYFTERVTGCVGNVLQGVCDEEESCFPILEQDEQWCTWRTGDNECPSGVFTERSVHYFGGFTDTRSCQDCACGELDGVCESDGPSSGWVALHTGPNCPAGWDASLAPGVGNSQGCSPTLGVASW